jgi:Cu+-exporting ATPase
MKKKIILKITGMHCASCEILTKEELTELPGVSEISVDAKLGSAELVLDETKNSTVDVLTAVKTAGYQAEIQSEIILENNQEEVVITNRYTKSSDPLKVKLETKTSAEGKVSEDAQGKSYFEGVIKNDHSAEFVIPENRPEMERLIGQLGKTNTIANLFKSIVEENGNNHAEQKPKAKNTVPNSNPMMNESNEKQRINLSLFGMHCSSCANIIERSLKKVPGVTQANVNFAAEKANVVYNEMQTKPQDLIEAIIKAGYKAELVDAKDNDYDRKKREHEIKAYFKKFWFSFAFSLPMLYFMLLDFFAIPGKDLVLPFVGIISLILTIPIQFIIGAGFYKGMWSSLKM